MFLPFALLNRECGVAGPASHGAGGGGGAGGRLITITSHASPASPIGFPLRIGMQHTHGQRSCRDLSLAAHERTWGTSGTMSHTGMRRAFGYQSHPEKPVPPCWHPFPSPSGPALSQAQPPLLPAPRGWDPPALQLPKGLGTNTIPARPDPHTSLDLTGSGHDTVSQWHCQPQGWDKEPKSQLHQELGPVSGEMQEWTNGPQGAISILNQHPSESPASLRPPLIPGGGRNIPFPAAPPLQGNRPHFHSHVLSSSS